MKVERMKENIILSPDAIVTLKKCGNIAEINHMKRENNIMSIRKLDKNRYVMLQDKRDGSAVKGEIREFSHNGSRKDDKLSVKESLIYGQYKYVVKIVEVDSQGEDGGEQHASGELNGKVPKAVIKGARLSLYPVGFHMYRISRGIKKPIVTKMSNSEAESAVDGWAMTYETSYRIIDEAREFENVVNKRFYNSLSAYSPLHHQIQRITE